MLERRTLISSGGLPSGTVEGSDAEVLDVVFSSNDGEQLCIVHGQENWPNSGWTPIGIVVVPGTHNRYSDNTCGVMSLVCMNKALPNSGQIPSENILSDGVSGNHDLRFGLFGVLLINTSTYMQFYGLVFLTSTNEQSVPHLSNRSETVSNSDNCVLWPYDALNNVNNEYYNSGTYPYVSYSSWGKLFCDFNGIRNTVALYLAMKDSSLWESNTTETYDSNTESQAAVCCCRFKTIGTNSFYDIYKNIDISINNQDYGTPDSAIENKGYWYMPSLGEMCYLYPNIYYIRETIRSLNTKYGLVGTIPLSNNTYGCSTGGKDNYSYCSMNNGNASNTNGRGSNFYSCYRPFMRI